MTLLTTAAAGSQNLCLGLLHVFRSAARPWEHRASLDGQFLGYVRFRQATFIVDMPSQLI